MSETYIAIHIVCSMVVAGILSAGMEMEDENSDDRLGFLDVIFIILLGPFTIGAIIGIALCGKENDEKPGTHDPSPTARGNSNPE